MNNIALIYVLFGDRQSAEAISRAMVEQQLAACANILSECHSVYPWDGTIEASSEVPVLFKTAPDRRDALMATLEQAHAYEMPAILSWPAETTAGYAAWVRAQTRHKSGA